MSDYEDYDNLAFPPQEERIEQKLEHSEKMRDYTAEYVAKLEEKLKIAEEALSLAKGFYGYFEMRGYSFVSTSDFKDDKAKIEQALAKIKE
jgi:hypothetical protein